MKKLFNFSVFIGGLVLLLIAPVRVFAEVYAIDAPHSTIGFAVKHLVVSTTKGDFTDYAGSIEFDSGNLESFRAQMIIQAKSIDTNNQKRDAHLRKAEFLDVEQYPTIQFESSSLVKSDSGFQLRGNFTIRGVTKKVSIPVEIAGPVKSPLDGSKVIGLSGEFIINRQDYGVDWSKQMDKGGLVVADNVRIIIELEAHAAQ
ncbi:hypothetical protein MNBD_BACTEROID05-569 [hydrothermal vent metagenome]|uniref:Lipid/polyisoprenoid-binding YceI-like domain-containing protein n=1 Tax=hydrothermal vent metagenome TaxID=652676 RepID=A0A3B0T531_9ZZZZ